MEFNHHVAAVCYFVDCCNGLESVPSLSTGNAQLNKILPLIERKTGVCSMPMALVFLCSCALMVAVMV